MKMHGLTMWVVAAAGAAMMTSCRHKDLYMEESMSSSLEVVFDWSEAPGANPESMALYLYENDGTSPLRYIFDNNRGGFIKAPYGTHHAICMNADNTDWARMRNKDNIETLEIFTQDAETLGAQDVQSRSIPRAEGTADERLAMTPGMLWGSRKNNIGIYPHQGVQTITMYPVEAVCHYTVDVLDVKNIGGIASASIDATLSGMAEGYNHGQEAATDTPVTMTFTLAANKTSDSMHGEFLTFGECPHITKKHYLTVYMILSDGSQWYRSYDVTDQVAGAPDPRHVHIVVRGLELPEPPSGGSGMNILPDVNEWQVVNIGLKM